MINQIDLGSANDNYEIYNGMQKAMAISSLKKNVTEFYNCWIKSLTKHLARKSDTNEP